MHAPTTAAPARELRATLRRLDGKGYKAYKDLAGRYAFDDFTLAIDHVQGDPFGAPSRLRALVPAATAGFPEALRHGESRRVALCDALTRAFAARASALSRPRGSGGSGTLAMDTPGQAVLARSSVVLDTPAVGTGGLEARFVAGLPARGRSIDGAAAEAMLCREVPALVAETLRWASADGALLNRHAETVEDADALRAQLAARGLVAFVADGAILPRRSGVDDRPLDRDAIPFASPESLRVSLTRPNAGPITGLGVPRGVTLIVGGGYHGKSTLLHALQRGVYNHVPGDGREAVVADPTAAKVRAEDGRAVTATDIQAFIGALPGGATTDSFTTSNASGSTSQAANIAEMLEAGAGTLLVDEDTSATNFMIRDRRMQALVAKDREPITPFVDTVRRLYEDLGVSTVLVIGGSGDYLDVADTVIAMDAFRPADVTARARDIVAAHPSDRAVESGARVPAPRPRRLVGTGVGGGGDGGRGPKVKVRDRALVQLGTETLDLAAVEQLLDASQARAIAEVLLDLTRTPPAGRETLADVLARVAEQLAESGPDGLSRAPRGDLASFRPLELAAALNRLRSLKLRA